jgi:hypothetical protein
MSLWANFDKSYPGWTADYTNAYMTANPIDWGSQLSHLSGGFGGGATTPKTTTPKTTTPTTTNADTTKAVQDSIAASKGFFDDLPDWSYYEPKSEEDFARLSSQFRDIYEMPQRQALERRLEQALADSMSQEQRVRANFLSSKGFLTAREQQELYALTKQLQEAEVNAKSQEGRIQANYIAQENMLREREKEQGRLDLESAIARGGGRSGVVPYMSQQRDQYYTGQLAGMSAQRMAELNAVANQLGLMQRQIPEEQQMVRGKYSDVLSGLSAQQMAELNAIANQLGLVQRQVPVELQQLAEQASRLEAQELQRLMDLDYARGQEHDMDQFNRMLQVFDRTKLTPLEQLQVYLQAAEVAGMFPKSAPDIYGMVGLPQTTAQTTATTAGKFNPASLSNPREPWTMPTTVTIGGREYNTADLAKWY